MVGEQFNVEKQIRKPAITGYITHQLDLPDAAALPFLRGLHAIDGMLVRAGVLRSTGVIVYARKPR